MHDMHVEPGLAGVDLNLLVVVDTILAERSVTRAARRLGLSQSAVSHALGRARALVGDPLVVRGPGGRLAPTARATALEGALRRGLAELSAALAAPAPFDPATARRRFRLAASDYAESVLLPPLLARLLAQAPGLDLWVTPAGDDTPEALAAGAVDLALTPLLGEPGPGLYRRRLFDERFVCVVRARHPLARGRMTLDRYLAYPHVLVAPRGRPGSYLDDHLEARGKRRRIAVAVPHFLVAPRLLGSSDLVLTLAGRVADEVVRGGDLVALRPPIAIPGFQMGAIWHERSHRDPGLAYLREELARAAAR